MASKEWNKQRYEEIRKEVDAIKNKQTTPPSKPLDQLLREVKFSKPGFRDSAYKNKNKKK